jgi:hypothetical protein
MEYKNTETLKVSEAATLMHKNPCFVRQGLIDKRFSFGSAVFNNGRWNFYINKKKFLEETGIEPLEQENQNEKM